MSGTSEENSIDFKPVCGAEGELRSNDCMMIVVFNKVWKLIIELNVLVGRT